MKDKLYQSEKIFKYQKGKTQWIENKILHTFLNEDLNKEKCFLRLVLCRTKLIRQYLKLNTHTILCKVQMWLKCDLGVQVWLKCWSVTRGSMLWLDIWFLDRLLWLLMWAALAPKYSPSQVCGIIPLWELCLSLILWDHGWGTFPLVSAVMQGQPLRWQQHQQKLEVSIAWLALARCHSLLLGTSASKKEEWCTSLRPEHTLHVGLSLATVWSNSLLQLYECLRLVWFKRGPWGFLNELWKKWNCDDGHATGVMLIALYCAFLYNNLQLYANSSMGFTHSITHFKWDLM